MALNLIVLGPPGAGKGTQAEQYARTRGIPKISTGDILREAVTAGTELGRRAQAVMSRGELVSDDVMIGIVRDRLDRQDARAGFVLDGFPRTVAQARELDRIMDGRSPLVVIDIEVAESELVRRLASRMVCEDCGANAGAAAPKPATGAGRCQACGGPMVQRTDDNVDVVRERLKVYHRQTEPLIQYYSSRQTYRAINGAQGPEDVAKDLAAAIETANRAPDRERVR